jgi:rhamnulokinase
MVLARVGDGAALSGGMEQRVTIGIDLGAESGRVMAGVLAAGTLRAEELHRFATGASEVAGTVRWDVERFWREIQHGLRVAGERFGSQVASLGVDSWGVDYVLLDEAGRLVETPWHYRDPRNVAAYTAVLNRMPREEIFAASGCQFMPLNTLYQLAASHAADPAVLARAKTLLLIADYVHFRLTGTRAAEFTNASTTQFLHPLTRGWSVALLEKLGLPTHLLPRLVPPGTRLGRLLPEVAQATGLGAVEIIAPATHDTASAVVAVPTEHTGRANWAYISSGTWSLVGVELPQASLTPRTLELNLTNEGGVDGTYRLLKNVMGLWLVQECRRSFARAGAAADYAGLTCQAAAAPAFRSLIDPDHADFLKPDDMPAAIRAFCANTGQPVPEDAGQFVRCALESLALKYAVVLEALEEVTGQRIEVIHIIGGGSQNRLLNQFTADACARPVMAGPGEATVLGNMLMQLRARGELASLGALRAVARASGDWERFLPRDDPAWPAARKRFTQLIGQTGAG